MKKLFFIIALPYLFVFKGAAFGPLPGTPHRTKNKEVPLTVNRQRVQFEQQKEAPFFEMLEKAKPGLDRLLWRRSPLWDMQEKRKSLQVGDPYASERKLEEYRKLIVVRCGKLLGKTFNEKYDVSTLLERLEKSLIESAEGSGKRVYGASLALVIVSIGYALVRTLHNAEQWRLTRFALRRLLGKKIPTLTPQQKKRVTRLQYDLLGSLGGVLAGTLVAGGYCLTKALKGRAVTSS